MESRKTIKKRLRRQKNSMLYRKGMALTTICATTIPMVPLTVFANEDTDQAARVHVVEHAADDSSLQAEEAVPSQPEQDVEIEETEDDLSEGDQIPAVVEDDTPMTDPEIMPEDFPPLVEEDQSMVQDQPAADQGQVLPAEDLNNARSANPQAFIQQVGPMAQQVASANDLYASIMIAQAILESGWGQSLLTRQANNMFGIKGSYNGQFVEMKTLEDDGKGNLYEIVARFRKYPSLHESFEDNAHVLRTTSFTPGVFFYSGAWRSNTSSYREAAQWLQGRYATDTTYASKLINLIETYNLTQYDSGSSGGGNTGNGNGSTNNQETAINQQFRTTAALNIRSDASTSASITGSLANNATFQAVASKTGTSVNGNTTWYRINGRGWVSAAYVTAVNNNQNNNQNNQETTINQQFRTTATLNIRSDASTSASITGSLASNATFQAVASKTGTSVNGNTTWYRINGRGWVSGAYVTAVNNNTSNNQETAISQQFRTTAVLNVRADASTSARITGSLARAATIQATARKTGTSVNGNNIWYRINNGWVSGAYLQSVSSSSNSSKTYTVKSGDTLWQIANSNGISVNQLMSWNNLSSSLIMVGQRLVVAK
ncbi:glucosaminidase domain-containing protein [Enterococcus sp.]|uniref:glucosaminidase domain-containing protein n=1 Tax=Enterococcus sp. TaxID=35783 RepID=UPI00289E49EF|nr:glucosaminidase domain-containing protein [Enterococcus sp.]